MAAMVTTSSSQQHGRDINLNSTSLPSQVSYAVPYCAQSCLLSYIQQGYTCDTSSLSCLCDTTSSQGFTLGELSLGCLVKGCSDPSDDTRTALYSICSAQPSAVIPTHTVLISLPPLSQTTASSTTSSATASTTIPASSIASPTSTSTSQQHASTTAVSAAASSSSTTTELSTAQAIGISIGAMGALVMAIAILMLVLCIRKRRLQKMKPPHDSYDFIDEAPTKYVPPMIERMRQGSASEWRASQTTNHEQKRVTAWPTRSESKPDAEPRRWSKGVQASRIQPSESKGSRRSAESTRTVSQLLPDKPEPSPFKAKEDVVAADPDSPTTVIDDDPMSPRFRSSQLQPIQPPPRTYRITNASPVTSTALQKPSADAVKQPSLTLDIPTTISRSVTSQASLVGLPRNPRDVRGTDRQITHQSFEDNIPDYYTTRISHHHPPIHPDPVWRSESRHKRKVAPARIHITHPTAPPQAVRASAGSDTSFESDVNDEPTPPEQGTGTAAVNGSPFSKVQYPKVPRPSNQAVSRDTTSKSTDRNNALPLPITPQKHHDTRQQPFSTPSTRYPSPNSSGSAAIAAKRRGSKAQHDLASGLLIVDSAYGSNKASSPSAAARVAQSSAAKRYYNTLGTGHESPLKGYGRVATTRMQHDPSHRPAHGSHEDMRERLSPITPRVKGQEVVLGSPMLWEPKITPSRRGDELFLSVSLATPCATPKDSAWQMRY